MDHSVNVSATRKNYLDAKLRLDKAARGLEAARLEWERAALAANYAGQYLRLAERLAAKENGQNGHEKSS